MNYLPKLSELTDSEIAAAARAAGEPEWLIERREAAWRFFAESVPPFWKRTDLTRFQSDQIAAPLGPQGTAVQWDARLAEQGVIFTTLAAALRDHEALVRQHLYTAIDPLAHKFTALHAALWQDGILLYVPKNVAVELPLLAIFTLADANQAIFPHNLIVVERGASVTFIEEYVSRDVEVEGGQALAAPATEFIVGDNASVRFVSAQTWGAGVYHIGSQRARIGRDGNLEWIGLNLGGRLQHVEAEVALEGNGSHIDWVAATFANGSQSLLTAPMVRHVGTNAESHMDFKTVVDEAGYSTFDGMVKIERSAQGTNSRLEEHAIHLSSKSRSDSIPGLQIDANDVKAGHASTSGQIDDEQLFYMLSRGIRRDEAIHMIVTGFFEPVIERIPLEDLRERVAAIIEGKI
ncbi:MAG TPA: Fe-S cluster assembly protein SufD [Roseiflexaceae bacterium]|nr:Fe-S cluster assembly protein SufD [Roseiflexaceae bacterium]